MPGFLHNLARNRIMTVNCPSFGRAFSVEYNHLVNGSFYHSIKEDGIRAIGISTIHMRLMRNIICPYCSKRFIEKRKW